MAPAKKKKCTKCGAPRSGTTCPKCGHDHKKGGKRDGAGAKKRTVDAPPEKVDGRTGVGHLRAAELIEKLNALVPPEGDSIEVAGWRRFWDSMNQGIAMDCRFKLYDKADGKALQTINHVHDKPLQVNATLNLGAGMRLAMEKAEKRVSGSKH